MFLLLIILNNNKKNENSLHLINKCKNAKNDDRNFTHIFTIIYWNSLLFAHGCISVDGFNLNTYY
jgi:hypothetical protein